jgi:hypothetical protein
MLYIQLSESMNWPLVRSPRDPIDCRAFNFDRWMTSSVGGGGSVASSSSSSYGYFLALLPASDVDPALARTVDCNLPVNLANYISSFPVVGSGGGQTSTTDCTGSLSAVPSDDDGKTTMLQLSLTGCTADLRQRIPGVGGPGGRADGGDYSCLESSRMPSGDQIIITRVASSSSSVLVCWLFTTSRHSAGVNPISAYYLLAGSQCHAAVAPTSSHSTPLRPDQLPHTVAFSRPRRTASTLKPGGSSSSSSPSSGGLSGFRSPPPTATTPPPANLVQSSRSPPPRTVTSGDPMQVSTSAAAVDGETPRTSPLSWPDGDDRSPKIRNSTMAGSDDGVELSQNVIVNGFVVVIVAVLLAVVQAIIFCQC